MEQKNWTVTFGVIAAFALLFRGAPPPEDAKKGTETEAAAEESPAPTPVPPKPACERWCEPVRLLEEYFGLPAGGSLDPVVAAASDMGYQLDVMIALIPDPVEAGLTYRSDEALEAIQRGFADYRHLFDRQWLPWQGEAAKARRYHKEPGALLFRRLTESSRRLTLVLIVGETPKGGVRKASFQEALALADRLRPQGSRPGDPVRILGPTFSGSTESVRIVLRGQVEDSGAGPLPAQERFRLITGSATAANLEKIFADQFGRQVVLRRTVVPDDRLEEAAYRYLHEQLGWDFKDMALLIEFDTSYGQGALNRVRGDALVPRFLVEFPSHLSRLRTAREKTGLRGKSAAPQEAESSRRLLEPSLAEEDRDPVDVVPQLSFLSTTSDDLALSNQLEAVCREGVRYIGILATDIQDRLFLAEHVRSHCPDVILFMFDNHLLTSHPQFMKSMEGTLVLTSMPLIINAQEKTGQDAGSPGYRRQYTSELQQGILLAVREHLRGEPEQQPRPWIAVVGKGRLWPLADLGLPADPGQPADPGLLRAGAQAQRFTIAGTEGVAFKWVTASAFLALLGFWLWRTARPVQLLGREIWMLPGSIPGARFFPLAGMGTLTIACGVLLVFYSLPLWNPNEFRGNFLSERAVSWSLNLLVLGLVFAGLAAACARLQRPVEQDRFDGWQILAWTVAALLLLLVLYQALVGLWLLPGGEELFYARAGDFARGISPLISLACLLAAVYTWAMFGVRRRRTTLIQGVPWPLSPNASDEPLATCGRLAADIDRILWTWSPDRKFWLALAVALLLPVRRLWGIQPVAEPALYGWFFLPLVAAGFTLGAIAFYRFLLVWTRLERILELLCHTWLLGVFADKKNSGFYDWKPLRSFGWRLPRHKMSLLSAEALRSLTRRRVLGADGAALAPSGALDRGIGEVIQAEQEGDLTTEVRVRWNLQKWFAKSTSTLERARPLVPAEQEEATREIDRFLSLRVVGWLRYVFAHLRYSLISGLACGLFVLLGVSTYAFQPKRYLSFGIWAFLLAASLLTLRAFVRMDRNSVLSVIGGTDPGKVSLDRTFFSNLFTYVGIPVLGVLLTQFPAIGGLLGDWIQPLLRLLTAS